LSLTRREWLGRLGLLGGVGLVEAALRELAISPAHAETPRPVLAPQQGRGKSVVILGAGIAGMTAAYELGLAGYKCTIVEARARVGGKNWTIRGGDVVEFTDGSRQQCRFGEGQYFNAGAGRVPSHHKALIDYCRRFDVALEVEVNSNHNASFQNDTANGGRPIALRRAYNDLRGHVSELLAKSINQHLLDAQMTPHDRERMLMFLKAYGDLAPDLTYAGSTRSGYLSLPGAAGDAGMMEPAVPMKTLLDLDMWHDVMFDELFVMQSTMLQPVGGMDQIAQAFAGALGDVIRRGHAVTRIGRQGDGVRITTQDATTGATSAIDANHCISTIPLAVLSAIPADFSPDVRRAIAAPGSHMRQKLAFQGPRFWETDFNVFGGVTYLKNPNAVIWHPSNGFLSPQGVLVLYGGEKEISSQPLDRQPALGRAAIARIYGQHAETLVDPVSVTWGKIPYSLGTGAVFEPDTQWAYDRLNRGDGPFFFAADYLSHINGWQEGAIRSAYHAIAMMTATSAASAG
jgi:monoamine oxidase